MIRTDWGDWLPAAVAEAEPTGVAAWYLGCNGLVVKGREGTTVFVDPYLGLGDPPRTIRMLPVPFEPSDVRAADAVLATHEHTDHVHGPTVAPILTETDSTFYGPADSVAVTREENWTDEWGVSDDQIDTVAVGDTFEVGEFTIHVEQAHDPDATQPVSYVIEHDAGTLFHAGDSKPSEELATIPNRHDIDLGFVAFGSVGMLPDKQTREPKRTRWYNDENQIVEVANQIEIDRLVPTHWDVWKHLTADPTALFEHVSSFDYPRSLDIVEIGDRIDVPGE